MGIPTDPPRFTTHNFRALVVAADKQFEFEGRHPVVYLWPRNNERRDPGDQGGPYANNAVEEE